MKTLTITEYLKLDTPKKVQLSTYLGFIPVTSICKDYTVITGDENTFRSWNCHGNTLLYLDEDSGTKNEVINEVTDEEWTYSLDENNNFFDSKEEWEQWKKRQEEKRLRKLRVATSKKFKNDKEFALCLTLAIFQEMGMSIHSLWHHLFTGRVCCWDLMVFCNLNKVSDFVTYKPNEDSLSCFLEYKEFLGNKTISKIKTLFVDYQSRMKNKRYK